MWKINVSQHPLFFDRLCHPHLNLLPALPCPVLPRPALTPPCIAFTLCPQPLLSALCPRPAPSAAPGLNISARGHGKVHEDALRVLMRAGMWRRVIACIRRAEIDAPPSKSPSSSKLQSATKSDAENGNDHFGSKDTSQVATPGAGLPVKATTAAMLMRAYAELGTRAFLIPIPVFDFCISVCPHFTYHVCFSPMSKSNVEKHKSCFFQICTRRATHSTNESWPRNAAPLSMRARFRVSWMSGN